MWDSTVSIKNICNNGSGYSYDDGLPLLWLNKLPFDMNVSSAENPDCSVRFENNMIKLETNGTDGLYIINVNI